MTSRWLPQRGFRRGAVAAASGLALAAAGMLIAPMDATADPAPQTIAQAKAQVATLQQQAEAADQEYLGLKEKLDKSQQDLKAKQSDLNAETKKVAQMRAQVARVALAQFQNRGLDTRARLFLTRDPAGFLNQFATVEKVSENQNIVLQNYQVEQANLADLQRSTKADIATLQQEKTQLAALRKKSDDEVSAAKAVLDKLTAQQRQAIQAAEARQAAQAKKDAQNAAAVNSTSSSAQGNRTGGSTGGNGTQNSTGGNGAGSSTGGTGASSSTGGSANLTGPTAPSSGKGAAAVAFAKAQVGKPYVFGATGPNSYDCSGLTLAAWRAAGVQLDRTSESQFHNGTPVSQDQLQPGDLVFFYDSAAPSHVGIYVGNGVIIHAPRPGASVEYTKLSYMPYVGARRPA